MPDLTTVKDAIEYLSKQDPNAKLDVEIWDGDYAESYELSGAEEQKLKGFVTLYPHRKMLEAWQA